MQFFACTRCNCVDALELAYSHGGRPAPAALLCSQCQSGKWHGQFEKMTFNPAKDIVINRPSGLGFG